MECKYVRECSCLAFTFHPQSSSLFYLTNSKNRLRIVEENLYTGLVINQFAVPLKEQNLNVDNYILSYNLENKLIILTLSNHILVYSLTMKVLIFVGEAQGKNPYFIEKSITKSHAIYFSASGQHNIYGVNLLDAIKNASIQSYLKFKLPPDIYAVDLTVIGNKLAAICSDSNLRVWDIETTNPLRGTAIEKVGEPCCLAASKNGQYLLIGTKEGYIQAWDGYSLGLKDKNTIILNRQISKEKIQSLSWFHYAGEAQSKRFLVFTEDGNIKLFSLFFEKSQDKIMGKANQLSLLYINRTKIQKQFQIRSHEFANFIYFSPGILLYMIDFYPRIYYPIITKQITHSFESVLPNPQKEVCWQSDFFYVDNLSIKRIRNDIQSKIQLGSVFQYDNLKILKMDYRPKFLDMNELPISEKNCSELKGKLKYKFLITYYLGTMIHSRLLSDLTISSNDNVIQSYKEYSGHIVMFLGPSKNMDPLILILQEDKQTITVFSEASINNFKGYTDEEIKYINKSGEIYTKQLKIKIQRIFETPFRNSYVLMYQSQNLIRFSNNIQVNSQLIDYEVYNSISLRLDYTDIVIDILWTSRGEIGCILCLEKVIFMNEELKVIKSLPIDGYVIQGQFIGYTLIITTKVDVQYVDISGKPLQLYCIENYQSKYLIVGILIDRIIGIEKINADIKCKCRFFNLMEPLLSGYLNYYKSMEIPINMDSFKRIIEAYTPYNIVTEDFINLLNKSHLASVSKYFIESHLKLYSRNIRALTLNSDLKMQRFIQENTWNKHKNTILDLYLYYEDLKDSTDQYELEKCKQYQRKLYSLLGEGSFQSIRVALKEENLKPKLSITNSFGEKGLFQIYYDYNEKENRFVKMEIQPFKAENIREWIGFFPIYIESKIADNESDVNLESNEKSEQEQEHEDDQEGGEYKDLIVYYRCDDGKGEVIDDLSDYANEGMLKSEENTPWIPLQDQPLESRDIWGKQCPLQYSLLNSSIIREKKINGKSLRNITIQIWVKTEMTTFQIIQMSDNFMLGIKNSIFYCLFNKKQFILKYLSEENQFIAKSWNQLTWAYSKQSSCLLLYINSELAAKAPCQLNFKKDSLRIGSPSLQAQFTQFRLWRKCLLISEIKDNLRTPLGIVAEKRKKLKMKIKQKKNTNQPEVKSFPNFPF